MATSFETLNAVGDYDGNIYKTVTIGTQLWMKENLKTTKYRKSDLIRTTTPVPWISRPNLHQSINKFSSTSPVVVSEQMNGIREDRLFITPIFGKRSAFYGGCSVKRKTVLIPTTIGKHSNCLF